MKCPPKETLIDYVAREIDTPTADGIRAHVDSGCHECAAELTRLHSLRKHFSPGALEEPPSWVLKRAQSIPLDANVGLAGGFAGRLARLVFDTFRDPLPAGVRSATLSGRQMLYRVLEFDIDIRVDESGNGRSRISGQVLPGPDRSLDAVAGAEVALSTGRRVVALSTTNEIGEFAFEGLADGDYALSIDVLDEILVVDSIELRAHT